MYRVQGTFLPSDETREIFVENGRFTSEGSDDAETLVTDGLVLPGLVDVHAHLSLNSPAGTGGPGGVRASLAAHRDNGVLAVREPGSYEYAGGEVAGEEGFPHVVTAGRFLSPPGAYFPGLAREVEEPDLVEAALRELEVSGGWVKLIGDSHMSGRLEQTYSAAAFQAAAAAVHDNGGRIAVHCMQPDTIQAAVDAGFDSVEHGTLLQEDQVRNLVSSGTAWVPTCSINALVDQMIRAEFSAEDLQRFAEGLGQQGEVLRAAESAGVTILAGTDAGMTEHGTIAHETGLLLAAGLSPDTALGAASWTARSWLGLPTFEEGAPADLVVYRGDPRDDLEELSRPALVMLRGRVVRRA